ncbi:hypothetical protein SDRG_11232 [Saprolegnia diclina VS20]|uniref:Uncharacterized protein n=1 Tax=Saprolegnia diclina (strain VS20) TaxID=1156394 RepID=T0QBY5_SAPDV|nr:hypothetical protein SDRG_11232 [Saprolegnia diclina VS20]EQC31045.1 hypothetical protein SDRG_11232 [Saprolegnia diclina VS20]|eukprot:XP_008615484.1 hypothetical protein SDRG_11232 [Saprolegnia diclina VS20]
MKSIRLDKNPISSKGVLAIVAALGTCEHRAGRVTLWLFHDLGECEAAIKRLPNEAWVQFDVVTPRAA